MKPCRIKVVGDATLGLNDLLEDLRGTLTLDIGIAANASPENIMKAIINEFGYDSPGIPVTSDLRKWFALKGYPLKKSTRYIKIPARPFISAGIYEYIVEIWETMDELTEQVHMRKLTRRQAMNRIGAFVVSKVQQYMESGSHKANHPLTVQEKGHPNPLMDTGELVNSLGYSVKGWKKK